MSAALRPMTLDEQRDNIYRPRSERRCIDCRELYAGGNGICDACAENGPRGKGRCSVYECSALADGWGSCSFCRLAKFRALADDPNALVTVRESILDVLGPKHRIAMVKSAQADGVSVSMDMPAPVIDALVGCGLLVKAGRNAWRITREGRIAIGYSETECSICRSVHGAEVLHACE